MRALVLHTTVSDKELDDEMVDNFKQAVDGEEILEIRLYGRRYFIVLDAIEVDS